VIPDEPGALARLLASAGEAGINVEDIAIEHSPGQPMGLVELSVSPEHADALAAALTDMGWSVH
jgi:prephenate dehydrogenase